MAGGNCWILLGLVVVLAALATPPVVGVTIPVPWDQSTNYGDFVKQFTFSVGDVLEFTYGSSHSVSQVTEANYDSCTGSSPIKHYSSGDDKVTLTPAGDYYFICPTPGHCGSGMKIKVTAVATGATPTTPTTPTTGSSPPPPSTTTTPGTTQSPPPPPPPPGNGASAMKISTIVLGASFVVATAMGRVLW